MATRGDATRTVERAFERVPDADEHGVFDGHGRLKALPGPLWEPLLEDVRANVMSD
jgi:hypothetical protein